MWYLLIWGGQSAFGRKKWKAACLDMPLKFSDDGSDQWVPSDSTHCIGLQCVGSKTVRFSVVQFGFIPP